VTSQDLSPRTVAIPVENAVQKLIGADPLLQDRLGLRGAVRFKIHANHGAADRPLSESLTGTRAGYAVPMPAAAVRISRRTAKGSTAPRHYGGCYDLGPGADELESIGFWSPQCHSGLCLLGVCYCLTLDLVESVILAIMSRTTPASGSAVHLNP